MDSGAIVEIVAVVMIFGGGTISYLVKGMLRIAELKATQQQGKSDTAVLEALEEVRREVTTLRETSTRFDMSFDAALTRLESRVDRIEGQNAIADTTIGFSNGSVPTAAVTVPAAEAVLTTGHTSA